MHNQSDINNNNGNNNNTSSSLSVSSSSLNDVNRVLTFNEHGIPVHSLLQPPAPLSSSVSPTSTPVRKITINSSRSTTGSSSSPMCAISHEHNITSPQNVITQTPVHQTQRSGVSAPELRSLARSTYNASSSSLRSSPASSLTVPTSPFSSTSAKTPSYSHNK